MVGLRFHALVAAGAAGTPFVALAHEPKLAGMARRLGRVSVSAERIVRGAGQGRAARRASGPRPSCAAVAPQIAAAEESMSLLRVLLNAGDPGDLGGRDRRAPAPARGMSGATITAPAVTRRRDRVGALRTAVRDQGPVAAGQALSGFGNLAFALVAARVLEPRAFAQLAALMALYLVLHLPATSLSAGSALHPGLAGRIRRRVLAAGAAVGGLVLLVGLPLAGTLQLSTALVVCLAAAAPAAGLLALERGRHYGHGHGRLVASLAVEPAVRLTAGVAMMVSFGVAGAAAGVVLAGYAALAVAADGDGPHVAGMPVEDSRGVGRAWQVVLVFLLLALVQNQDVLLANAALSPDEAGRFAVLSTLGGIAAFATTTVPLVLLPRAAAGAPHALAAALGAALALGGGAALVVALSPEAFVSAVFGDRYAPVAGLAVPYLIAMALLGVARVLAAHASATGATRTTLWILGATAVLHVALVLGIGRDAAGVATATLASTAVLSAALGGAAVLRLPASRVRVRGAWRAFWHSDGPALVGLSLVALGLRLLVTRGLWLDEATTWYQASLPTLGAMLDDIRTTDVHPPLHHVITWLTVHAFGDGEYALRAPSIAAGVLLVPALYGAAREAWDRRTGLIVATLATVAPILVWYSQEARMYSLLLLFGVLAAWAQQRALRTGHPLAWLAYVLSAAAVVYTQYFGVFLLVALHLALIPGVIRQRRESGNRWRPLLAVAGATALLAVLLLPLAPFALDQFATNEAAGRGFDQPAQAGGDVAETGNEISPYSAITNAVWAMFGYHSGATMARLGALWPFGMLGGAADARPRRLGPHAARGGGRLRASRSCSRCWPHRSRFCSSCATHCPACRSLCCWPARAIATWPRGRVAPVVVAGLATITMLGGLADQQLNGTNPRFYDFEGALGEVTSRSGERDIVLYEPPFLNNVIEYYEPDIDARPLDTERLPRLRRGQHVYVLGSFLDKPQHEDSAKKAARRLNRRAELTDRFEKSQVRVWEFGR